MVLNLQKALFHGARAGISVFAIGFLGALVLLACDEQPAEPARPQSGGSDNEPSSQLEVTAKNLRFNTSRLIAPAGTQVTLTLQNEDAGVLHNIAIYTSRDAQQSIFIGDLFAGVATRQYEFNTPPPGTYFFRCDSHPDTMNGTFTSR
jgi:plastocyanin